VPLYLGFDSSTQSVSAIVLDVDNDRREIVFESSCLFDDALPEYGTRHGILPDADPSIARSSPLMWADALDLMLARVARSGLDLARLAAISGSAQQHGSVYFTATAPHLWASLDARRRPGGQIASALSRRASPIWLDSSTSCECAELTAAVGGADVLAMRTGSRAFERFTGPQIRRFFKTEPAAYAATDRIHLVSSFLASLLVGSHAPIDPGDGSGMNLMDLSTAEWWPPALEATAPNLAAKLPPIRPSSSTVGTLAPVWQRRHGLPPARVVAWSGDNPCSLIGTGLVHEGLIAISLGTSDTIFGLMREPRVDRTGTGHVFGAPTGGFMGLTCFSNGSLARERVRDAYGLTWDRFSDALTAAPPANHGRILLPWFEPEITPTVAHRGARRYGLDADDVPGNVRGVVEAQQIALARHSQWMGVDITTIYATGGAAANRAMLQVMADVFGADVYQFGVRNTACLGAALRAFHGDVVAAGGSIEWNEVVRGVAEPAASTRIAPDPARHAIYRDLMPVHAACEAHALGRGPDPMDAIDRFRSAQRTPSSRSTTS
jgi:xylulokinase